MNTQHLQASTQNYSGQTTTVPNSTGGTTWVPQGGYNPHVCPGCGRCKDCGRPYETQPYPTWPGYPNPYIGDWPPGITWISTITSGGTLPYTVNGGLGAYSAQFQ